MRIGRYRHRVTLLTLTPTATAYGSVDAWTTYKTLWARVAQGSGGESGSPATRESATDSIEVFVRYRTDLTTKMRLQWQGRQYDIEGIGDAGQEDARGRELVIRATARDPDLDSAA